MSKNSSKACLSLAHKSLSTLVISTQGLGSFLAISPQTAVSALVLDFSSLPFTFFPLAESFRSILSLPIRSLTVNRQTDSFAISHCGLFRSFHWLPAKPLSPRRRTSLRVSRFIDNGKNGSKTRRREWANFCASEFAKGYGTKATKLSIWQALCEEVRFEGPIDSITKCKNVCLQFPLLCNFPVDIKGLKLMRISTGAEENPRKHRGLIDARRTGKEVKIFPSKSALRNYTRNTEKFFPKRAAKQDGFKALLREIF